jgi:hypothetical protein
MAEYFGSSQQSSKDIDYSWILFMHLNRVSETLGTLLSIERPNTGQLANCWAQVKWTETLLAPFLPANYYTETKKNHGVPSSAISLAMGNMEKNLKFLEKLDNWHALLIVYAYNNRLLRIRPGMQASESSGGNTDVKRKAKGSEVVVEP